jgi:SET domain-containing protein
VGHLQIDPEMYNQARLSENQLIATPKVFQYDINHSCDPNAMDQSKQPTWTHYIALRDILAQEEITADYYEYEQGELETCACMSPRCRWTKR